MYSSSLTNKLIKVNKKENKMCLFTSKFYDIHPDIQIDVKMISKYLKNLDFCIIYNKSLFKYNDSSRTCSIENMNYLKKVINSDDVRVIVCLDDGNELLYFLSKMRNLDKERVKNKIIIGLNSATILSVMMNQIFSVISFQSLVKFNIKKTKNIICDMLESIESKKKVRHLLTRLDKDIHEIDEPLIKSKIVGGNISSICTLLGNEEFKINTSDRIFFLECGHSDAYSMERYMLQIYNARLFEGCNAVVFNFQNDNNSKQKINIIKNFAKSYINVPIYRMSKSRGIKFITLGSRSSICYLGCGEYELSTDIHCDAFSE